MLAPQAEPADTDNGSENSSEFPDTHDGYWAQLARERNEPRVTLPEAMAAATGPKNVVGEWGSVKGWPFAFQGAAHLPDGRIMAFGAEGRYGFAVGQGGSTYAGVWDPATDQIISRNHGSHDMFCAIPTMLEDGRVFVNGGNGTRSRTSIFNYQNNSWSRTNNMNDPRWYPGSVALPSGQVYTMIGDPGGWYGEVWTEGSGWRWLTGANLNDTILTYGGYQGDQLPYLHLMPNGKVFHSGPTRQMNILDLNGNGSVADSGLNSSWYHKYGAGIMFDEGKILIAGGGTDNESTNRAIVLDINGSNPSKREVNGMRYRRKFHNGVMLPNGEVLMVGGNTSGTEFSDSGTIFSPEIWNPDTEQWREMANHSIPRNYHSVALLMTDGRVWSGGGGLCNCNADHPDHQIFSPPYLFDSNGSLATRPVIFSAADTIGYGWSMRVQATAGLAKFSMIKMSGVTHNLNSDLRYLDVNFTETSSGTYQLSFHSNENVMTPGYWMLFAINNQGVPSVSKVFQVSSALPASGPPIVDRPSNQNSIIDSPTSLTISASDSDPNPLTYSASGLPPGLSINSSTGEIAGTPTSLGAYNVTVTVRDSEQESTSVSFNWQISEQPQSSQTSLLGGGGGASFDLRCQDDEALVGIHGSFSYIIDRIGPSCVQVGTDGTWQGSPVNRGDTGGNGGSGFARTCPANYAVYEFSGRSGTLVDQLTLGCRALRGSGLVAGSAQFISAVGGNGGDASGPYTCDFNLPAIGIIGRSGTRIDSFGLNCGIVQIIEPVIPISLSPMVSLPSPEDVNTTYTASASGGNGTLQYKWLFGDNTAETAYSTSPTVNHSFSQPGRYIVTVTVRDSNGQEESNQFYQAIHATQTTNRPAQSSSIIYEARSTAADRIWNVNPDNDTVSVFSANNNAKLAEITVGDEPHALALAPDGRVWVTNQESATISIINAGSLSVANTISLARGSQPYGIAFSPTGNYAYVVLEATGEILKLNPNNGNEIDSLTVGSNPRHLAINASGTQLYVSRFITPRIPGEETGTVQTNGSGGEVLRINANSMSVISTITLAVDTASDNEAAARGVPNYLGAPVISLDGGHAWIPSKEDNILRGGLRDGQDLNHEHTVRAVSSYLNLSSQSEMLNNRIDHDDASLGSAGAFGRYGNYYFVALETSREVAVVNTYRRNERFRFDVGRAPQGLVVSADGLTLYVHNFMDRSMGVYDLTSLISEGREEVTQITTTDAVATEALSNQVLNGKQLFYDARDTRLTADAYMSCASCHNDGGHDGRIWDFTDMGEGLRNTISLKGRGGPEHGRLHWSANFDEIHDFEEQIRDLAGGSGLMSNSAFNATSAPLGSPKAGRSTDLDALAAYVNSLTTFDNSPHRTAAGNLTADAQTGRTIFAEQNCASCHSGIGFTDSPADALHDIGTLKPSSGQRAGQQLPGIDTPTLRGLWATAPYLHDGSAATVAEAIQAHQGVNLSASELNSLVSYLDQIDDGEVSAPVAEQEPTIVGDVNCNGSVNSVDALFVMQYVVGIRSEVDSCPLSDAATMLNAENGDVNNDDVVDTIDALFILQCEVGLNNVFCPAAQ